MSIKFKQQTMMESMNSILSGIVEFYGADYAYYIEKKEEVLTTIYEWCKLGMPFQKEYLKGLPSREYPEWITGETSEFDFSRHMELEDGQMGILAVVNVTKNTDDIQLLHMMLPQIAQTLSMQRTQIKQEFLSYHDDLTGLLNRNSLVGYLESVDVSKLTSIGALCVDINGLKLFNNSFGREYGDEVVVRVGEILEDFFRGDRVFRLTGDEYMVLSENISYEDFKKQMIAVDEKLENISLNLTTMGHAWEKVDIDIDHLVDCAEEMMRKEKDKQYKMVPQPNHTPIIKEDLLEDIAQGNYIVCLQPRVDVESDEVIGAEALVRYRHKDLGIVEPEKYLKLLEKTKLSHYLDIFVFEEVCKVLRSWIQRELPVVPISVNFAGSTLREENTASLMLSLIEKYHVPYEYLEIEVSETDEEMNQEMLAETSEKIRKQNIRVILDNFGTKNSSLSILSIMEFDGLKLDKGLITNIVTNTRSQIVTKAIVDVCRELGSTIAATGVETQDQLNILKELRCDYAQGYIFNKPIAVDTFEVRYLQE